MATKNILQTKFAILLKLLGKTQGFNDGEWSLDYAQCYGGYHIVEHGERGSEHHPFMSRRLLKAQMEIALDMAIAIKRLEQ